MSVKWSKDADKRLKKVPFFVRKFAKGKVEKAAAEAGMDEISVEFMDKIKKQEMGR